MFDLIFMMTVSVLLGVQAGTMPVGVAARSGR